MNGLPPDRPRPRLSRRTVLGLTGAALAGPLLSACTPDTPKTPAAPGGPVAFWDMAWGTQKYTDVSQKLVGTYRVNRRVAAKLTRVATDGALEKYRTAVKDKADLSVSSGDPLMAFRFEAEGSVHYADAVVAAMKTSGAYDDLLPGTLDIFKSDKGYLAVPWGVDQRVLWYNTEILERAGVEPPKSWSDITAACRAVARKVPGVVPFVVGAGPGEPWMRDLVVSLMINNAGGLFDEDGNPDATIDRNVEAVDFVRSLVVDKLIPPESKTFSTAKERSLWNAGRGAIGIGSAGLANVVPNIASKIKVLDPPAGPNGDVGGLQYVTNLVMYNAGRAGTAAAESFVTWYLDQVNTYWVERTTTLAPAYNSIANNYSWADDPNKVKASQVWGPVCKPFWSRRVSGFAGVQAVHDSPELETFIAGVLAGRTLSPVLLGTLQTGLEKVLKG